MVRRDPGKELGSVAGRSLDNKGKEAVEGRKVFGLLPTVGRKLLGKFSFLWYQERGLFSQWEPASGYERRE